MACHDPFDATGARNARSSVVAVTATKSVFNEASRPGVHPVPLNCTTVPGGPLVGDIANDVTAAPATPAAHHAVTALTTPMIATQV